MLESFSTSKINYCSLDCVIKIYVLCYWKGHFRPTSYTNIKFLTSSLCREEDRRATAVWCVIREGVRGKIYIWIMATPLKQVFFIKLSSNGQSTQSSKVPRNAKAQRCFKWRRSESQRAQKSEVPNALPACVIIWSGYSSNHDHLHQVPKKKHAGHSPHLAGINVAKLFKHIIHFVKKFQNSSYILKVNGSWRINLQRLSCLDEWCSE